MRLQKGLTTQIILVEEVGIMSRTIFLKRILLFAIELIILLILMPVFKVSAVAVPDSITLDVSKGSIVIGASTVTCGSDTYPYTGQEITITGATTSYTVTVESGDSTASGDTNSNSPDSNTSDSGNPDDSKKNPYTGGIRAMAISIHSCGGIGGGFGLLFKRQEVIILQSFLKNC